MTVRQLLAAAQPASTEVAGQHRHAHVLRDTQLAERGFPRPILRDKADAGAHRLPWAAEPDAVPVEDDLSTGGLVRAEDHVQDGLPTGTDEAGQSDDLATAYLQRSTSHGTTSQLGDRQQHLCQVGLCVRGRQRLQLATQDQLYQAVVIDLGPPDRGDHRTVAEHRDRVGDLHDLLEPVSHEHDGNTLLGIASQRLEQHGHLRGGQTGRRLVQHQDAGLVTLHVQGPGDGHHGLRRWTEGSQVVIRVRVDAVPIQDLTGLATQPPPWDGMGSPPSRNRFSVTDRFPNVEVCW